MAFCLSFFVFLNNHYSVMASSASSASHVNNNTGGGASVAVANAIAAANKLEVLIESFVSKLRRKQVSGSYNTAIATCKFLMRVTSVKE